MLTYVCPFLNTQAQAYTHMCVSSCVYMSMGSRLIIFFVILSSNIDLYIVVYVCTGQFSDDMNKVIDERLSMLRLHKYVNIAI